MGSRIAGREVRREVRFAVVMYGGVSLAIYINGVVQELFKMIRATATKEDDTPLVPYEKLRDSERVYRRLGQMLGRDEEERKKTYRPEDPILTRFVIDILSGTSAGGINAVYLAKALANGQEIDRLKDLWIEEGDIDKLVNDKESVTGLEGLTVQKPPKSLLNSRRMYHKLLAAFKGMEDPEDPSTKDTRSPYLKELDLFITATDIEGLHVPLQLPDKLVWEKRHRNFFHLRYDDELNGVYNDFHADNNAFLAFIARCTSAFPFAFEPMKLSDVNPELGTPLDKEGFEKHWGKFFPDYRKPPPSSRPHENGGPDFVECAFGDGGYLDNKPFGYATEALATRRSGLPVSRKLIYIEPSPEQIEGQARNSKVPNPVPNAIENTAAALSLARYETIREDLHRIRDRNRLIEKTGRIVSRIRKDVDKDVRELEPGEEPATPEEFAGMDLTLMIKKNGAAYGGYHRLKVESITDEITELIARVFGFDADSDEFLAIRYLVRAWRRMNYTDYLELAPNKQTENRFVLQYDLPYRIRRLEFVLNKLDRMARAPEAEGILGQPDEPPSGEELDELYKELRRLRTELGKAFRALRIARKELNLPGSENPIVAAIARELNVPGSEDPLPTAIAAMDLDSEKLADILRRQHTDEERLDYAERLISDHPQRKEAFKALAIALEKHISESTLDASHLCEQAVSQDEPGDQPRTLALGVRARARHYYNCYDQYDMVSYPILYSAEVGEEFEGVEVVRISPEDATSVVDEKKEKRSKLAGTRIRNFGAFFESDWRENDFFWGRMDGAERVIMTLLRGSWCTRDQKEALVLDAQREILADKLGGERRDQPPPLLIDSVEADPAEPDEAASREPARRKSFINNPRLQPILLRSPEWEALLDLYNKGPEVSEMNRETAFETLGRSSRVVGDMLQDIANGGPGSRPAAWVARVGRVFWGLVELSTPGKLTNKISRNLLSLLYAFEVLLILIGVFVTSRVLLFGIGALIITAVIHGGTLALGDYMHRSQRWWLNWPLVGLAITFIAAIILLAVLGAYHLPWEDIDRWLG